MENQDNMEIWEKVCTTKIKDTKQASLSGMQITSICPQSQRMRATEIFGPFGKGWGIRDETWTEQTYGTTTLCRYNASLWYRTETNSATEWSFPITGTVKVAFQTQGNTNKAGYFKVDEEYAKKVATDALTKGLSFLGFNADIFLGKYDDNKYIKGLEEAEARENMSDAEKEAEAEELQALKQHTGEWCLAISKAEDMDALIKLYTRCKNSKGLNAEILAAKDARKEQLLILTKELEKDNQNG